MEEQKKLHGTDNIAARAPRALPTVKELREALAASENSDTRKMIASLFDDATFSEIGVYMYKNTRCFMHNYAGYAGGKRI